MSVESVAIYWHPDVLKHNPGKGCYEYGPSPLMSIDEPHPETPERLINMEDSVASCEIMDTAGLISSRKVELGLSDGMNIEIVDGLEEGDLLVERPPKEITGD